MVTVRFATHPGGLEHFDWPVTAAEAREALDDFIANRLPHFGRWEGAMWSGEPWLYHSRLSAALNLKLHNPREVVAAAERAWREKRAPIASVKRFIRQILGWRECVRGIYWRCMPGYLDRNTLGANQPLPAFYWTGGTDMDCLRHTLPQTLDSGYAHHIQHSWSRGFFCFSSAFASQNPRVVSRRLCQFRRTGRTAQHPRPVAIRRWRRDGLEALYRERLIYRAYVELLHRLPLRSCRTHRPARLSLHHALLGFPPAT